MRICIFTDSFLPFISGVSFAVLNQANALSHQGHEVTIFRPKPFKNSSEPVPELEDSVTLEDIPLTLPFGRIPELNIAIPLIVSSLGSIRKIRPDVVHVHTEWGCGWEGMLLAKMLSVPLVGTFHTFFAEPEYLKQFFLPDFKITKEMMWRYSVFFFRQCQAMIAPSKTVQIELIEKGLSRDPIIISNGLHLPKLLSDEAITQMRTEKEIHGPAFIYVGRVSGEKSLDIVLKAFAEVNKQIPESRFVVAGDGNGMKDLKATRKKLGLEETVLLLGHTEHEQLLAKNIPRLGDAFVTASKTENQPVSILEAMAMKVPIIGPRAKGIPELIEDGRNGFLFEPDDVQGCADHMLTIARNTDIRDRMSQASLDIAQTHSCEHIAKALTGVYEHAIETYRSEKGTD